MNLCVLSGHGSESFAAFLNVVILQKNNAAVITAAVVTAAVITAALFFCYITTFKNAAKDSLVHAPTIQTNSFCFGEICIYTLVLLLIYLPGYQC